MALFRRFFYRKPPDGLLEISERVFVFDCCFTTDVLEDDEYKAYMGRIVESLREYSPDSSFMVFNFREGDNQSQIAHILSEYDMTVMDYPRQYENCPLLRMETIHHFLRSSESWLSLGQQNTLLMHCERGGWPVLAFMLAALLIYRKQYTGEQKTLDMIYKQAPRELLQLISPLNPLPSQLRYLQYVSRRNVASEWPPLDRALTLDCVILRFFPNIDGEGGCCPIFRIYGQDPLVASDRAPKVLFSLPKKSRSVRQYKQEDCELVKIDIRCQVQGDVVLECISLDNDLERETMVFRVMFNTAFIRSNILMLNRDEIDSLWSAKNQFPNDFRTEVLFSEMDASSSLFPIDLPGNEEKGLPIEAFAKVQEMFSNVDWLVPKTDEALSMLQEINIHQEKLVSSSPLIAEKINLLRELCSEETTEKPKTEGLQKIDAVTEKLEQSPPESAREKSISEKSEDSLKNSQSQALGEEFMAPLKTSLDVKLPAYSKIISQRMPRTSVSTPASYCNSFQGSPMPISRYHSAPSALGITALLHDHKESENKEINHHVRISPSQSFISSQPSLEVPTDLTRNVLLPSLSSTPSSPLVQKSFSAPSTPPPPPPPPIPSSSSVTTPTFKKLSSASCPLPTLATTPPPPPPPRLASSSSSATSAPPHPPSPSLGPASSPSITSSPPPPPPPPTPTPGLASSLTIASSMQPPPPFPLLTPGPTSSDDIACSTRPPPLPPPPPPGPSRPSTASSAPQPPPPPSLVPNTSLSKNSSLTPPVPPPPVPFSNGLRKTGSTSPHSHSVGSNENIPPVPGPPSTKKGRLPSRVSSRSQDQSRKTPLKPYHWLKLTRAMSGSLWAEAQKADEASKAAEIDISELESLFAATLPSSNNGGIGGKSNNGASGLKSDKVNLVDLRRAYNCEIMLTKVKVPLPELMSSVLALDDTALDIDQVENLIKFCPTKEEIELLKNYNGDREKLGKCEQFFLEMMKVPRVESKLRVFAFKIHFCTQVSDLRNNLNTVNSVAEEIRNSVKLKRTMQTILSLGNALNHGTARGSAVGFRLDSLLKLTDTRARNNKMTLMHYLCKVLAEKLPELLDFPNDLISLEAGTKIQLKYLAEEMQAISKGLEKVIQELTVSGNDGLVSENFCKILKEFLGFAEAEVRSLASLYSGVGRNADALALYFGEDPARTPFEQVVSTLLNFVRMFVRAREENCKRLELEKKKAQKEAENENTKNKTNKREVEVQKTNSQKGIRNSENGAG